MSDLPSILTRRTNPLEAALEAHLQRLRADGAERELADAMAYALLGGGKRLRAALLLEAHALTDRLRLDPFPMACALEFIHAYSLVHDDLPSMDDDDLRRGRPSCHVRYGEALAILAGDALLTEAFGLPLLSCPPPREALGLRLVGELVRGAGARGMVSGQVIDIRETGRALQEADLERLHRLKTGALIRAAVRCGAILGGAADADLASLSRYADALGLAFQAADDALDATGTEAQIGKSAGKDRDQNKTTYVTRLGVEGCRAYAEARSDEAVACLSGFDARADGLRELARFAARRER